MTASFVHSINSTKIKTDRLLMLFTPGLTCRDWFNCNMSPLLLDLESAADAIGIARGTLRRWAYGARPAPAGFPLPVRLGRLLRYRVADLEAWVSSLAPQVGASCRAVSRDQYQLGHDNQEREANSPNSLHATRRPRGRPKKLAAINP